MMEEESFAEVTIRMVGRPVCVDKRSILGVTTADTVTITKVKDERCDGCWENNVAQHCKGPPPPQHPVVEIHRRT